MYTDPTFSAPRISGDDLAAIIYNLQSALAIFERRRSQLKPVEISALNILDVLRKELEAKLAEADRAEHHQPLW